MSEFDYGNARLRAMKTRLFPNRKLDELAEVGSLQGLIAELSKTAYQKSVEAALARTSGMDCLTEALRNDLVSTLGKMHQFYHREASEMVALVLRSYDVQNLKAILRGLSRNVPQGEIVPTLIPVGELDYHTLVELVGASRPRAAIDMMASMNLPYAQPLLKLRAERPGADTLEMELALERWYYQYARKIHEREFEGVEVLSAALSLDADLANLLTVLRLAHVPGDRRLLKIRFGIDDLNYLFFGPGRLPFKLLARARDQDTVEAAVETLAGTPYEPPLRAGLSAYANTGRLGEFEKRLRHFRLDWAYRLIAKDPLGIGMVIGYLALKVNEVSNLRWIAQGVHLGLNPEVIKAELEFAP